MEKLRDATRHLDDEFNSVPQKFTTREILTRNIRQMNLSHIKVRQYYTE